MPWPMTVPSSSNMATLWCTMTARTPQPFRNYFLPPHSSTSPCFPRGSSSKDEAFWRPNAHLFARLNKKRLLSTNLPLLLFLVVMWWPASRAILAALLPILWPPVGLALWLHVVLPPHKHMFHCPWYSLVSFPASRSRWLQRFQLRPLPGKSLVLWGVIALLWGEWVAFWSPFQLLWGASFPHLWGAVQAASALLLIIPRWLSMLRHGKRLFCSAGKLSCHLFCHFCHVLLFLYGAECSCNLNGTIFAHSFIFEWGKFDTIH
jgi:hypothetical protein